MNATGIQWTDFSVNPIRARDTQTQAIGHYCEKISSGCANCYSSNFQKRFKMPEFPGVGKGLKQIEPYLDEKVLLSVLKRRKPARIFWADMTDMFGDWVPFEWVDKCFAVMALTPHLTHQILTKRPERMAEYLRLQSLNDRCLAWRSYGHLVAGERPVNYAAPLPNVWLGVSLENQKMACERIPHLLKCPARVRFISAEPLLEGVNLQRIKCLGAGFVDCLDGRGHDGSQTGGSIFKDDSASASIDWVIAGGESGPGARPCNIQWIRSIVEQCKAAKVACFVKQLGAQAIRENPEQRGPDDYGTPWEYVDLKSPKGGNPDEWPADLRVRQMPEVTR